MDGKIRIFDVSSGREAAVIELGGPVKSLQFSENGTWLACVARNSTVISIWDIRKIANGALKELEIEGPVDAVEWDYTGQFLAAAGPGGVTVNQWSKVSKEWSELLKSPNPAASVIWGKYAQSLLTTNADGAVNIMTQ